MREIIRIATVFKRKGLFLFLLVCFGFNSCSQSVDNGFDLDLPELIPYRSGELWGYCDQQKNVIIKPQFNSAELFDSCGYALVYLEFNQEVKCGLINKQGDIVIPIEQNYYTFAYSVVEYDNLDSTLFGPYQAYKSMNDLLVVTPNLRNHSFKSNPKYIISNDKNKNIFKRNGELILADSLSYITHHSNLNGEVLYILAKNLSTDKQTIRDVNGKRYNSLVFDETSPINDNLFHGKIYGPHGTIKLAGIYKLSGEPILIGGYDVRSTNGDFIRVNDSYFSLKHHKFIGEERSNVWRFYNFYNGFAKVPFRTKAEVKYKLIDTESLKEVVPGLYDEIDVNLVNEHIVASKGELITCSNLQGKEINRFVNVDTVVSIDSDRLLVESKAGVGIWSISKSDYIIQPKYQSVNVSMPGLYILGFGNGYIVSDLNGNVVSQSNFDDFDIVYPEINYLPNHFFQDKVERSLVPIIQNKLHSGESNKNSIVFSLYGPLDAKKTSLESKENQALKRFIKSTITLIAKKNDSIYIYANDLNLRIVISDECSDFFRLGDNIFYTFTDKKSNVSQAMFVSLSTSKQNSIAKASHTIRYFFTSSEPLINIASIKSGSSKHGLINGFGNVILETKYKKIERPTSAKYMIARNSSGSTLLDGNKIALEINNYGIKDWYGKWGEIYSLNSNKTYRESGVVNINGKIVIPCKYKISYWGDNLIGVSNYYNDKLKFQGYYDINGVKYL